LTIGTLKSPQENVRNGELRPPLQGQWVYEMAFSFPDALLFQKLFWVLSWQTAMPDLKPCRSLKDTGKVARQCCHQMQGTP
jgi:hypothetical protein